MLFRRHACNFFAHVRFLYTSLKNLCAAHLNIKLADSIVEKARHCDEPLGAGAASPTNLAVAR